MNFLVTSVTLLSLIPLFLFLSFHVIRHRVSKRVSLGDSGDEHLFRKIRMHANFTEYTPIAIILLALCEVHLVSFWILVTIGSLLVIGRYLHALGIANVTAPNAFRISGMMSTFSSIIIASIALLLSIL